MSSPAARKMGRRPPHPPTTHPRLKFREFLRTPHPSSVAVPAAVDYISAVTSWPMFLNDSLSDCTVAQAGHSTEGFTEYGSGTAIKVTDQDVLTMYEAVSGYVPGQPSTDNGAVIQDVLTYWRKTGLGAHKILAFFEIDPTSAIEVKTALYLLGAVTVGVNLPQSALDQADAGQPWTVSPAANNQIVGGHAIHLGGIDADGTLWFVTWGKPQAATPAWFAKYAEETWGVASAEWISNFTSPEGLNVAPLNAAFEALTGEAGPFAAPPPPVTPPVPTPVAPSAADIALAAAIPAAWLTEFHIGGNDRVRDALKAWLATTGLKPGK